MQLPSRKDNRIGRKAQKAPTRDQVQRVGPASDPGARGGPSNVPLGAFGGGEGLESAGKAIANIGTTELENLRNTELKMKDDAEKNASAKLLILAKQEYEELAKFPWDKESTHEDGIDEEFTENGKRQGKNLKTKGSPFLYLIKKHIQINY